MDPEALMRMMQMGDQSGGPQGRGSGRPRGGAPNGAPGAVPDIGALLSSLGPDGMPDFDKIARQTGMDPAEMRGHAQRLWKHMDELAEKSPDEYRSFLEKQADNAGVDADKAFGQAGGAGAGGGDPKDIAAAVEKNRTAAATAAAQTAMSAGRAASHATSIWRADSTWTTWTPGGSGCWVGPVTSVVFVPRRISASAMAWPCLPDDRLAI